jgi:hypothetical protein
MHKYLVTKNYPHTSMYSDLACPETSIPQQELSHNEKLLNCGEE